MSISSIYHSQRRRRSAVLFMAYVATTNDDGDGVSFRDGLSSEGRQRRDRRLPRPSLLHPHEDTTPWMRLYSSKNDAALITVTGFDCATFDFLLQYFKPVYDDYTPYDRTGRIRRKRKRESRGRKRTVDAPAALAIVLLHTRTKGARFVAQSFFGVTGSPLSIWLRYSRRVLLHVLRGIPDIQVKMPSASDAQDLANVIRSHYPVLDSHFCVCDGLKLPIEASGDIKEQGRFYNGWTHGHYVTNLFGFAPDGMIIFAVLNAPGAFHDSSLAEKWGVYEKLQELYDLTGLKCIMDSAFSAGQYEFILKSAQTATAFHTASDHRQARIYLAATSMRQAAEWGMRALQGSMPRLTDTFPYEDGFGERGETLVMCTYLYNLRCKYVGLNQLRNTFVPNWSRDAMDFINY